MMPRHVIITTSVLTIVAGVFGFILGQRWQPLDETQVISGVVAEHIRRTNDAEEQCFAVPGQGAVWLSVLCGSTRYDVNRRGVVISVTGPGA